MSKDTAEPVSSGESPPAGYQRTTGGKGFRWEPPTPQRLAELLSGYEIECMLGRGGMGAVYKGKQKSLDRMVAIKILPPGLEEEDPSYIERFKNEAKVMAKFMHPGIVAVHDFGETAEGQLYIVMEYVDGTDVQKMISTQGKLPPDHALAITAHVCDALKYAHERGVIHRDIKPANILINREGAVKVADFGLAKAEEAGSSGLTKTGMAMGTPDYVAPEALMIGAQVDGRADLYAVGVMLYQMLTGQIPRGAWQAASVLTPGTDRRFDAIITKAMQYDRESRYQTSGEIRRDLDAILTAPQAKAAAPSQETAVPQSQPQKPNGKPPQPRSAAAPPAQKAAAKPQSGQNASTPSKSKTPLFIGIGAAAALGIGTFVMLGGMKPAAPANPSVSSTPTPSVTLSTSPPVSQSSSSPSRFPLPLPTRPTEAGQVVIWRRDAEPLDPADPLTKIPAGMDDVVEVTFADGGSIALALHRDGRVTAWGNKNVAEGMTVELGDVVHLAGAHSRTAFALRSDGSVMMFGKGVGEWTRAPSNARSFVALKTADDGHSGSVLGLQRDGKVFCWGRKDDDPIARLNQQIPKNLERVTSIGFGDTYLCALRDDGTLVTWGRDAPKNNLPKPMSNMAEVHALCHPTHGGYLVDSSGHATDWGEHYGTSLATNSLNIQGLANLSSQYAFAAFQDSARKWHFVGGTTGDNLPNVPYSERLARDAIQVVIGPKYILAIKPKGQMEPVAVAQTDGAARAAAAPVVLGEKRYQLFAEHLDWHAAQKKCAALKGRLAEVRSKEENDFLVKLAQGQAVDGLWIGATDEAQEGRWLWSNGSPLSYTNWDKGQPNNQGAGGENYAMLLIKLTSGKWWDQPDTSGRGFPKGWRAGYVCEWDEKNGTSATSPAIATRNAPMKEVAAPAVTSPATPLAPPQPAGWLVEAKKHGGTLHGWGQLVFDGKKYSVNVSEAGEENDFVRLSGDARWLRALRRAGELLSIDFQGHGSRRDNVTSISESDDSVYATDTNVFIDRDSALPFRAKGKIVGVHQTWGRATSNNTVLLNDGTTQWFRRDNSPLLHQPPDIILRDVAAISSSGVGGVNVLKQNGSLLRWNAENGEFFDYGPEFRSIAASHARLALTKDGRVLSMPNAPQPPGNLGPAIALRSRFGVFAAQAPDGTWKAWGDDEEVVEQINHIGKAIDILFLPANPGADLSKTSRYVIWIEPALAPGSSVTAASTTAASMKAAETSTQKAAQPPELTELQKRMDGLTAERVTGPFEAGVKKLNTSYAGALDREVTRFQKAGDLDAVLALNNEKKRMAANEPLLGDDSTDPAVLKPLRNTYRAAVGKLDATRAENQKTLTEQYDAALKKLETDLTRQNRIPDAATVRAAREALDKSVTTPTPAPDDAKPSAAVPVPAATPKSGKPGKYLPNLPPAEPIPAALSEPPPRPQYTRQLAEWALSQNDGAILIRIGQQSLMLTHQKGDKVPSDKFELLKIIVRNVIADKVDIKPEWLLGQTELEEIQLKGTKFADFSVLRGMSKLKQVFILEGGDEELIKACTEARAPGTFRQLPLLPAVTKLQISAAVDDEDIRCISERLPALQQLDIHKPRQITTLVPLQRLASLERLEVRDNNSVISHLKDLAPLPALETLILGGMSGVPVADWESVSKLANLHELQIHQASLSSGSLTALKPNQLLKLERLVLEYNVGMGGDASVIGTLPKLMRLHLAGNGDNKAKTFYQFVMSLPPQPSLEEFACSDIREWTDADWDAFATRFKGLQRLELRACSALTDRAVQSFAEKMPQLTRLHIYDTPVTDAMAVPLRSMRKLEDLMIGGPNLTPVILVELRKLRNLKKLFILTRKLPQSAINDFKKARSDVEVIVEVKP